jgi:hypothetical protein
MTKRWGGGWGRVLLALNVAGAASTGLFAAWTVVQATQLAGGRDSIGSYAAYYGVRGAIIGAVLLLALWLAPRDFLVAALVIAGLVQVADIPIGFLTGNVVVWIGAPLVAAVHLGSIAWVRRSGFVTR